MARIMVIGTDKKLDYLAIARKGNLVLSVKPNMVSDGNNLNVPGVTYFGARLRSADAGMAFDALDKEAGVGAAVAGILKPSYPWGGIEWEKADPARASSQVGIFLRGSLQDDADKVLSAFSEGQFSAKFAAFLYEQAGDDVNFVIEQDDLATWIEESYAPQLKKFIEKLNKHKKAQEEFVATVEQSVGVFASQSSLLKAIYSKHKVGEDHVSEGDTVDED